MNRHDQVKSVFFGALDVDPDELDRYLAESCGEDHELRREIESLLGHHDRRDLVVNTQTSSTTEALLQAASESIAGVEVRYTELGELGVGGCGRVTATWDHTLRRRVARKSVVHDLPLQRAMLLHEARLLAWLDHPGSVPVYDIESRGAAAGYTMRLLDGESLRDRLDTQGPLPVNEAVRILSRVCETMANAHAKGVLHLDLKPANLMLLPFGQVCVIDWGVARFHDLEAYARYLQAAGEGATPSAAAYDGVAGTPNYMPKEQAAGDLLGPETDVYATGTILYEMLAGHVPHPTTGTDGVADRPRHAAPLRRLRADVPPRLDALCERMLAAEPSRRPADFGAILEELAQLHGSAGAQTQTLEQGETLFREGDLADDAFQILEGVVSIVVHGVAGPTEIAQRSVGDLVGEMGIVLGQPRSATVVALQPTRVARITGEVISRALDSASPLVAQMVHTLSARLRQETTRSKDLPNPENS